MILADKIIRLRKKNGWSQEELAERLSVSRQSVSKWEGAQSTPDLDKILQLGKVFGVSIDYLLKDELEEEEYTAEDTAEEIAEHRVSLEEANAFLAIKKATAGKIAFAVFLCILSPICLILLGAASEINILPLSEIMAGGIGLIMMFVLVAVAVAVFILCGAQTKPFEYLEKETIDTEYGVSGMVKERQKQYWNTYTKYNVIGACLCILSVLPLLIGAFTENALATAVGLSVTLLLVAIGAAFFIIGGINWTSMEKLLEEGDYTKDAKKNSNRSGAIKTIYWLAVVAIYLGYSFSTNDWKNGWIIWPVAALIFAALMTAYHVFHKKD
ncbi:MAG: helix-turn-helix transcriptional regulator [Clostridiales bacterium]|nr:helix-turn-helix transcriptional regulator [Clostridiales bacterium]